MNTNLGIIYKKWIFLKSLFTDPLDIVALLSLITVTRTHLRRSDGRESIIGRCQRISNAAAAAVANVNQSV